VSPTPAPGAPRVHRPLRLAALAAGGALLVAGCDARDLYENSLSLGFPKPVTDQAERTYELWLGSVAAAAVVGVFVWGLIFFAVVRYRKKGEELPRQVRYNLPVEVLYTAVPFVILAVLFYYTAISENYINKLTKDPQVTIGVVGFQWNWQFNYQNEALQVTGAPGQPAELVLPVNRTIRFVESSPDVIHSFWVPEFLFKRDVIPGRTNTFEITIREQGRWIGRCAELCGEKHDRMNFYVRAVSEQAYDDFVSTQKDRGAAAAATAAVPAGSSS
jgi:cytochrome c oxidase subunit II